MAHPLRRGWRVAVSRLPIASALRPDAVALVIALTGLLAFGSMSRGGELPDSVLLDFTANWCQPCQRMSPVVHKLQQQGYAIQKVDVDQQQKLAQSFGITSIPTFVLVVNGQEVNRITGPTSEEQLRRMAQQATQKKPAAAAPPRQPLPLSENVRLDADPLSAPKSSVGLAKDRRQPLGEVPAKKGFPSLFSRKNPADAADRNRRDEKAKILGQNPAQDEAFPATNRLVSASARLRVSDDTGSNFGSGTILDSRVGRTVILTCGHLFQSWDETTRDSANSLRIEVDIFLPNGRHQTYAGKLVDFDLAGDVGLVTIETAGTLSKAPLAPLSELPVINDRLLSIGCGGGEQPTAEPIRVTALNRYDGPENIECTGVPIQGRSGGGLFDAHGQLVGVCIAADQEGQRGLYAGLQPIHALLTKAGLKQIAPPAPLNPRELEPAQAPFGTLADDRTDLSPAAEPVDDFLHRAFGDPRTEPAAFGNAPSSEEISQLFQQSPDAEVICLVRPKNGDAGRVVILNQASTKFVSYLLDSMDGPRAAPPRAASLRVEDPSDPLGDAWVPDDGLGVPKQAPDFADERRGPPAQAATASGRSPRRSRFGSRSEN